MNEQEITNYVLSLIPKEEKDTVKASPTLENPDVIIEPRHNETPVGNIKFREKNDSIRNDTVVVKIKRK